MKKELQEVYIPIKEHSEFKVLEGGLSLQNVYPQEAIVFTQEEYNNHLKEIIELTLKRASNSAAIGINGGKGLYKSWSQEIGDKEIEYTIEKNTITNCLEPILDIFKINNNE